jgi:hypothetical protein
MKGQQFRHTKPQGRARSGDDLQSIAEIGYLATPIVNKKPLISDTMLTAKNYDAGGSQCQKESFFVPMERGRHR